MGRAFRKKWYVVSLVLYCQQIHFSVPVLQHRSEHYNLRILRTVDIVSRDYM